MALGTLRGLPGTKKEFVVKEYGHTVTELMRLWKRDGFSTTAGNEGAITIWTDDAGFYRATRDVRMVERSAIQTKRIIAIKNWLKRELPKIY